MPIGVADHRFAGIHEQVQHHLLHLHAIGEHRGQYRSRAAPGNDIARDEFTVHQVEGFAHQVVEFDGCVLRVALAQQGPQALDDLRGAFIVLHDILQDFDELSRACRTLLQHAERRLGVAEDRGERLFELVRERARQLTEHRGARQVRELLTLIARSPLRRACAR